MSELRHILNLLLKWSYHMASINCVLLDHFFEATEPLPTIKYLRLAKLDKTIISGRSMFYWLYCFKSVVLNKSYTVEFSVRPLSCILLMAYIAYVIAHVFGFLRCMHFYSLLIWVLNRNTGLSRTQEAVLPPINQELHWEQTEALQ